MSWQVFLLLKQLWFYTMVIAVPGVMIFRWCHWGWPPAILFCWFALVVWAYIGFKGDVHFYPLGELTEFSYPQIDEDVHPFIVLGWFFSGVYCSLLTIALSVARSVYRRLRTLL